METLIAYATKYGATEKAAKILAEKIEGPVTLMNLKEKSREPLDLTKFDVIAVGGSIYAGGIQKEVQDFCSENEEIFLTKKLGLFLCCGNEELAEDQLTKSFSGKLLDQADAKGYFGYEFDFEKMGFLTKLIVKKISKVNESKFRINEENIKAFAEALN